MLHPPVTAIRPTSVPALPTSMPGGILYQVKLDGHRVLAFIDRDEVVLQARSQRIVTTRFPEILDALATRAPGTVLDGEVIAWREGAFDFPALAATPKTRQHSGIALSYIAFDLLCDRGQDIRDEPLEARWPKLLTTLDGAPTQLQPVLATRDRTEAELWMKALAPLGMEGLVCKALLCGSFRSVRCPPASLAETGV